MLTLATTRMKYEIENSVGWMIFNHPERHNALSLEMWQGMGDILEFFERTDEVRVVAMRGAGDRAFVSGADISEFDRERSNSEQTAQYGKTSARANHWLKHLSKPLIAMIDGYCIGGGLATALMADIRIASSRSTFGIPAARLGLGYDYPGVARLCHIVGPANARNILFSAARFDADSAHAMGLVHSIHEAENLHGETMHQIAAIADNAPLTVAAAKAAINAFEAGGKENEIDQVGRMVNACFDSQDYREGRLAFAQKRAPTFYGR